MCKLFPYLFWMIWQWGLPRCLFPAISTVHLFFPPLFIHSPLSFMSPTLSFSYLLLITTFFLICPLLHYTAQKSHFSLSRFISMACLEVCKQVSQEAIYLINIMLFSFPLICFDFLFYFLFLIRKKKR